MFVLGDTGLIVKNIVTYNLWWIYILSLDTLYVNCLTIYQLYYYFLYLIKIYVSIYMCVDTQRHTHVHGHILTIDTHTHACVRVRTYRP